MKALLSVSDKSNLDEFASSLLKLGYVLYATSGTAKQLSEKGIEVHELSEITGFSELASGRVKTLNEKIFEMILAPTGEHFDLVVVNLYPFGTSIPKGVDAMVENFDIGGVALMRAASKNYRRVTIISSPTQYNEFLEKYPLAIEDRREFAKCAMETVVRYDTNILSNLFDSPFQIATEEMKELRYGENPHQQAWAGKVANMPSLFDNLNVIRGNLSYNNYIDLMSAVEVATTCGENGVTVVKHTNPCGASMFFEDLAKTFERALSGDPKSAFGGVLCVNGKIDSTLAKSIKPHFWDMILAREITAEARELFKRKSASLIEFNPYFSEKEWRIVNGVVLVQESNLGIPYEELQCVTSRKPSVREMDDVKFGLGVIKNVKSNAVILVKDKMLIGLGAGQPSRVDSANLAIKKAKEFGRKTDGAVMISDGFFPFPDSVQAGLENGIKCFAEPGGSKRDNESISACEEGNASMIFTSKRLFKH